MEMGIRGGTKLILQSRIVLYNNINTKIWSKETKYIAEINDRVYGTYLIL